MERIICDSFWNEKTSLGEGFKDFDQRAAAVNNMYGWLAEKGILEKISFEYRKLSNCICFAFDVEDLKPYRHDMAASGIRDVAIAVHHIFDEPYSPCMYCGAIQPGWIMGTYRSMDGCVSRSWECDLITGLNNSAVQEILDIQNLRGVKEAVKSTFLFYQWPEKAVDKKPSLASQIKARAEKTASIFKEHGFKSRER